MTAQKRCFEDYIRLFPKESWGALEAKLAYKRVLDAEERVKIPQRVWLAFLTPPDKNLWDGVSEKYAKVLALKSAMLKSLETPRQFLKPAASSREAAANVTLAVLEILYDLKTQRILLGEKRYEEWLEVAEHFSLWRLRYILEDEVFRTFDPENYRLFQSVIEKQMFIEQHLVLSIRAILEHALTNAGLKGFKIDNRRKNIFGIYKKVALKDRSINEIFDIHGFRVLTKTKKDCYEALAILHRLWPHFPERFKDYIAKPKENGYQSLHTVVRCLEGKLVEFQIRTFEMDEIAASGPANHEDYRKSSAKLTSSKLS